MKSIEIARKEAPSELPKILVDAGGAVARVGKIQKDKTKAKSYLEKAISLIEEGLQKVTSTHKDADAIREGLYNNLGVIYSYFSDLADDIAEKRKYNQQSLEYKLKAFEFAKKTKEKNMIIRDLLNIGQSYHKMALLERSDLQKSKEFLQEAIHYLEDAIKEGENIGKDPLSERHLMNAGELLSLLLSKMLLLEKDYDKTLEYLSKKISQDRRNIKFAKERNINPMQIAMNCISAASSIRDLVKKLDDVMIIRKLQQESIELFVEASKILEEIQLDPVPLVNTYQRICQTSQELSRILPNKEEKYKILIFGKQFGEKAFELLKKLDKPILMISICDSYGLLVHDLGHALEHINIKKAKKFFNESITIFQKGLEIAKEIPQMTMAQAVLLDYIGGTYRDLANLADNIEIVKNYFQKSVDVKEKSLKLFEKTEDSFEIAVTAHSLTISLLQLASVESDPKKVIDLFTKARKYNQKAEELFTKSRKESMAIRCKLSRLTEIEPRLYLRQGLIEKDPLKRWDYIRKVRDILKEAIRQGKVSPFHRSLAQYILWEYPKVVQNGIEAGGIKVLWHSDHEEIEIINTSYNRALRFRLAILESYKKVSISKVQFEAEIVPIERGISTVNALIKIIFENEKEIHLKVLSRTGIQILKMKRFQLINPSPETIKIQISSIINNLISSEASTTIIGERNIFIFEKTSLNIQKNMAVFELNVHETIDCLYQITILPKFSGILCITNPNIEYWKYNLAACLFEGPLTYQDAPHIVETDFSPIIFMDEKGNLPTKFFNVEDKISGSLVEFNTQYPAMIRKILIFGEIFKEKSPYERMVLLDQLKEQITNIATLTDPFAGITIITSDPNYFDEMFPFIEREKQALAQYTGFLGLSQVAKLLQIIYLPREVALSRIGEVIADIRDLNLENLFICDDPSMAFLCVPYCRFIDSIILTSAECTTKIGGKIFQNAKRVYIAGKLSQKLDFKEKDIINLGNDIVSLSYELHNRLKARVKENWEHFINSNYRELYPELRKELFGDSIIITSKESTDLSYLILASSYAAAKLSSILLIDRDKSKLKVEADLFKQVDLLTYQSKGTRAPGRIKEKSNLMKRLTAFSQDLRKKYFDEQYIQLIDDAKFISIISDIPLPLELMQYGGETSFLSLEKAVGRLCSTNMEETSILIQFSVLQAMMKTSEVNKAMIIAPEYFGNYSLHYAKEESEREARLLRQKRNLGKENVVAIIGQKITRHQFFEQLSKSPWLFIHYVGHGDLVNRESCFLVQPSEYTDLLPIRAKDLPEHLKGQPVFIASACLSGRYKEGAEGLSGLVFEIIKRGAISFIGTLWEVDDLRSSQFVSELFIELLDGQFIGDALKKSRKVILDQKDPTYAAFILFGDPMVRIR